DGTVAADVFFAGLRARGDSESRIAKIRRLFTAAGIDGCIRDRDLCAIKLHFGERGCDTHVNPVHVRQVVDMIRAEGGRPFLTDTATLYSGSRSNAVDHIATAIGHGFGYSVVGAPIIIADGLRSGHAVEVKAGKKHFDRVFIAGDIAQADSMVVISHFKGHMLAGFGGAIKNLAMGCAPARGKREEHQAHTMVVEERCRGCGNCVDACPAGALSLGTEKVRLDKERCIGCGECMTVCLQAAIEFDWTVDIPPFVERMVEYACGALEGKRDRAGFFNFLLSITPDCDCVPWSDAPIVPDIGILASRDPVAIDAASLDLVNRQAGLGGTLLTSRLGRGEDKFGGVWEHTNGSLQLSYAEECGLGERKYRLVEI
ncbi:MAG TPA: DUF362 domain-containing protein, partial [Methanomicrobiales archaeon]|nr:DUF362 domain-containing protein [Methanomicrobiales archaeon]